MSAGFGGVPLVIFSINAARSSVSAGFHRFSKANVDEALPLMPAPVVQRTVIRIEGNDRNVSELYFTPPGGKEQLALRLVYTRI